MGQCLLREDSSKSNWLKWFRLNSADSFGKEKNNTFGRYEELSFHFREKPTELPFPNFFRKTRNVSQRTLLKTGMVKKAQKSIQRLL